MNIQDVLKTAMSYDTDTVITGLLTNEQVVAGTLEWVNMLRGERDLEPLDSLPNGKRYSSYRCPIARATKGVDDGSCRLPTHPRYGNADGYPTGVISYALDGKIVDRAVPPVVAAFILRFDHGQLDHLLS